MKDQQRIFAIGDIHGHAFELQKLFQKLRAEADLDLHKDHLVLCGDLVDSGSQSKEVVTWVGDMLGIWPETFHPLKGNHDDMMVDALKYNGKKYTPTWWFDNYAAPTIQSYGGDYVNPNVPLEHIDLLDSLPLFWWPEDSSYFFCHAGIPPAPLSDLDEDDPQTQEALLWIRGDFYNSDMNFGRKIIFGHTAFEDHTNMDPEVVKYAPLVKENMIGINTKPRNLGQLTALELPEERFWRV